MSDSLDSMTIQNLSVEEADERELGSIITTLENKNDKYIVIGIKKKQPVYTLECLRIIATDTPQYSRDEKNNNLKRSLLFDLHMKYIFGRNTITSIAPGISKEAAKKLKEKHEQYITAHPIKKKNKKPKKATQKNQKKTEKAEPRASFAGTSGLRNQRIDPGTVPKNAFIKIYRG